MRCPVCKDSDLQRTQYEEVNIHSCPNCHGTLMNANRLKAIQRRRTKSDEELETEFVADAQDTPHKIRCERCVTHMKKRKKKLGETEFMIDECAKCRSLWLDAGELAKLQLIYEMSDKGMEAKRFQDRLRNMSPADKAEFEERIASLPEEMPGETIGDAAGEVWYSYFRFWS